MDDLNNIFGELARLVPDGPPGESEFVFDTQVLPNPPSKLTTERVVFRRTHHDHNGWQRADLLLMFVEPATARELGLFMLACVFHAPEAVTLELPASSDIRRIIYRSRHGRRDSPPAGLHQKPVTFSYFPEKVSRHPWLWEPDLNSLPLLALSSLDESPTTLHDWETRDTVFLESSAVGTVRLAELLLNAGCSWNTVRDFELEGDAGFRGVARMSAELRIILPGSHAWLAHPERS